MARMTLSLIAAAILATGCRSMTAPVVAIEERHAGGLEVYEMGPKFTAQAWMDSEDLHVVVTRINRSVDALYVASSPEGWAAQVMMNTDRDAATGVYAGGYDYVGRIDDHAPDQTFPVRLTTGGPPGGWGPGTGTGYYTTGSPDPLHVVVPLDAIDDYDGLDLMIQLNGNSSGNLGGPTSWKYFTVLPPAVGLRAQVF